MVDTSTPLDGLDASQAEMMEELVLCLDTDDNVIESSSKLTTHYGDCLLYTSPSPRDYAASRMPSSA